MGTPDFAVAPLRALVEGGYEVVAVVTTPDKPAGRGLKLHESPVKQYAQSVGIPVLQPVKLRDEQFIQELRAYQADLFIVVAFRMLPEVVWTMPPKGTFNLHASLLPQYRGAAPINWAIINGEHTTGVTTFFLKHEIDTGDILFRQEVPILPTDNAGTLHDKLMTVGADLVVKTVEAIGKGSVVPSAQAQLVKGTELKEAPKIFRETCQLDWSKQGIQLVNLIRGLSPHPAAFTNLIVEGEEVAAKIFTAHFEASIHSQHTGSYLSDGKTFLKVACADGYIYIDELQMAGKKRLGIEEFLRGFRINTLEGLR